MKDKLYVAYGSNLNLTQMKLRCPTAKLYGVGELKDYELQFKGMRDHAYATIAPSEGASVPVALWKLKPDDEATLDIYEGYPSHYYKDTVEVTLGNKTFKAMVYIMNPQMDFGVPSKSYYQTVRRGYLDCKFDVEILDEAVRLSEARLEQSESEDFGMEMM